MYGRGWPYTCPRLDGPNRHPLMSSFATYLIGFIVLIIGLSFAAYLLNVPGTWIAVGVIVLLGIGILMATNRTKPRDPPAPPPSRPPAV